MKSKTYVEFVGGPLDGKLQEWPHPEGPGRAILFPSPARPEAGGGEAARRSRQVVYVRRVDTVRLEVTQPPACLKYDYRGGEDEVAFA